MKAGHLLIVEEFARVRRAEHPGWRGDRILNSEAFLWRLRRQDPVVAAELGRSLSEHGQAWSEATGLSPRTIAWAGLYLEEAGADVCTAGVGNNQKGGRGHGGIEASR